MPWVIRAAKSRRSILHVHFYTFWTRPDEGPLVARAGGALRMDHLQNGAVNVPLRLTGFKTSSPGQRLLSPRHQGASMWSVWSLQVVKLMWPRRGYFGESWSQSRGNWRIRHARHARRARMDGPLGPKGGFTGHYVLCPKGPKWLEWCLRRSLANERGGFSHG